MCLGLDSGIVAERWAMGYANTGFIEGLATGISTRARGPDSMSMWVDNL